MSCRHPWLLLALAGLTASVSGEPAEKEQLRQAVKLPTVTLGFFFGLDSIEGFAAKQKATPAEVMAEIAALKKAQGHHDRDGDWHIRLGELYTQLKETNSARNIYVKAVGIFQQQVKLRPDDATAWVGYGRSFRGLDRQKEAEAALRQAVKLAPQNATALVELGNFLAGQSVYLLMPSFPALGFDPLPFNRTIAAVTEHPPTAEARAKARQFFAESGGCFDRAVAIAPQDAELYAKRYAHRTFFGAWFRAAMEKQPATAQIFLDPDAVRDLRRAAELATDDYLPQRFSVMVDLFSEMLRQQFDFSKREEAWRKLPKDARHRIDEAMARLTAIASSSDKAKAGGAAESLGVLEFLLRQDTATAEAMLRRAVSLDPTREQAWDMLLGVLFSSKHTNDMLAVCQQRLAATRSVRNHLLVAKAAELQGKENEVAAQVRAALKLGPKDALANLAQAALSVRSARDAAGMSRAAQRIVAAAKLINDDSPREQQVDIVLLQCIHAALSDQADKARHLLNRALRLDPNNEHAKDLLKFKSLRPVGDSG